MSTPPAPPPSFNLAEHLIGRNAARGDRIAYVDDDGRLSYGELAERVRRFASVLREHGLRREERVLLLAHDSVDWPVAFLGAIDAGIVPVAVNTLLTPADYAYMLSHSRARAAIVSVALLPTLERVLQAGENDVETVWVIGATAASADRRDFGADVAHAQEAKPAPTHADDVAFWLYSSGSTGAPKGTVHTHANAYWTDVLYAQSVLQLTQNDVCYSAAKLFFAYGLGNALTFPLSAGATTVLMAERPTPQAVFRRLTEHRATVFFGVPTLYAAMLAAPELPARSAVAMRVCVSAGEALPRDIGERFTAHFGSEILDGIGSTEMLHIFLSNRAGRVQYGTTGEPVPGYDVELRGEDGRPVADDGEVGDLYIRGPSAALMYWTSRDKSRGTFQGEWTKSGDKYLRRVDGCYVYCGRSDDMLKVSGLYVSPFEVEAALVQHPAVLEAAVIGKPDADGLTKTKAFIVLKTGQTADATLADTLKTFVKDKLAPYKYPRYIEFIAELPKTATGKIQRFRLREREEGRAS